ncbi:hypothetical protein GCM10009552_29050 [Rothia nasimurium]
MFARQRAEQRFSYFRLSKAFGEANRSVTMACLCQRANQNRIDPRCRRTAANKRFSDVVTCCQREKRRRAGQTDDSLALGHRTAVCKGAFEKWRDIGPRMEAIDVKQNAKDTGPLFVVKVGSYRFQRREGLGSTTLIVRHPSQGVDGLKSDSCISVDETAPRRCRHP